MLAQRMRWKTFALIGTLAALAIVATSVSAAKGDDSNTGAYGYVWVDSDVAGLDIYDWETGSSTIALSGSDGYDQRSIPANFEFEYYGTDYCGSAGSCANTAYYITADGHITFTNALGNSWTAQNLPSGVPTNGAIAPMWQDYWRSCLTYLYRPGPTVLSESYLTTDPHPRWIISYENWPGLEQSPTNDRCSDFDSFAIKLFDGTDIGEFQYQYADNRYCSEPRPSNQACAGNAIEFCRRNAIGIEDATGNSGINYRYQAPGSACRVNDELGLRWWVNDANDIDDLQIVVKQGDTSWTPLNSGLADTDDPLRYYNFDTSDFFGETRNVPGKDTTYEQTYASPLTDYRSTDANKYGTSILRFDATDGYDPVAKVKIEYHVNAPPEPVTDDFVIDQDTTDNKLSPLKNNRDPFFWCDVDFSDPDDGCDEADYKPVTTDMKMYITAISTMQPPLRGTVTISDDFQDLIYTPNAGTHGFDEFTITISDGHSEAKETVRVYINPPPEANPGSAVDEFVVDAGSLDNELDVVANDADVYYSTYSGAVGPVPQPELRVNSVEDPLNGDAIKSADSKTILYTPDPGYGPDQFSYTVTDGRLNSSGDITVQINAAPITVDDKFVVNQNSAANPLDLTANDWDDYWIETVDADGNQALHALITGVPADAPAYGALSGDGGVISYQPNAGFYGPDEFAYFANDGRLNTTGRVEIIVNQPPVAVTDTVSIEFGAKLVLDVLRNDYDLYVTDANGLRVIAIEGGEAYGATLSGDGKNIEMTAGQIEETVEINYTLTDGYATTIGKAIINIKADAKPVCNDNFIVAQGAKDEPLDILANDVFPNGPAELISATSTRYGELLNDGFQLYFTPPADFAGPDRAYYRATDGVVAVTCTIDIVVDGPAPEYPIIHPVAREIVVNEGGAVVITQDDIKITDDVATANAIRLTLVEAPINGKLTKSGTQIVLGNDFSMQDILDGSIQYEHDGSETLVGSFKFKFTDGVHSDQDERALTVIPVNDVPKGAASMMVVDVNTITLVDDDYLEFWDGDNADHELIITLETAPALGNIAVFGNIIGQGAMFTVADLVNRQVTYEHSSSISGSTSAVFKVSDGDLTSDEVTLEIEVLKPNIPPQLVKLNKIEIFQGEIDALNGDIVLARDPDGTPTETMYWFQTQPSNGRIFAIWEDITQYIAGTGLETRVDMNTAMAAPEWYVIDPNHDAAWVSWSDLAAAFGLPPASWSEATVAAWDDAFGDYTDVIDGSISAKDFVALEVDWILREYGFSQASATAGDAAYFHGGKVNREDFGVFYIIDPRQGFSGPHTLEVAILPTDTIQNEQDIDGDGIAGWVDNCHDKANVNQADADGDGAGRDCDAHDTPVVLPPPPPPVEDPTVKIVKGKEIVDADHDRVDDAKDNCKNLSNPDQRDTDGDGVGDFCDKDADGDGMPQSGFGGTRIDNCPLIANEDQADSDGDGVGDACDTHTSVGVVAGAGSTDSHSPFLIDSDEPRTATSSASQLPVPAIIIGIVIMAALAVVLSWWGLRSRA